MYEAITHAENRVLFGQRVTEFPQIRQMLAEVFARLAGMKLYSERAVDYMRSAWRLHRRYLFVQRRRENDRDPRGREDHRRSCRT